MKRSAVIDPDHHRTAVGHVGHAHIAWQRQGRMSGGHRVHVIGLAAGGFLAVKLAPVPRARTALTEHAVARDWHIGAAKHHIGPVGGAAQGRLVDRNRIGRGLEIGRRIIPGAIILVVGTTPRLPGFGGYRRCRRCALRGHWRPWLRRRGLWGRPLHRRTPTQRAATGDRHP